MRARLRRQSDSIASLPKTTRPNLIVSNNPRHYPTTISFRPTSHTGTASTSRYPHLLPSFSPRQFFHPAPFAKHPLDSLGPYVRASDSGRGGKEARIKGVEETFTGLWIKILVSKRLNIRMLWISQQDEAIAFTIEMQAPTCPAWSLSFLSSSSDNACKSSLISPVWT